MKLPNLDGNCIKCGKAIPPATHPMRLAIELPNGDIYGPICRACRRRFLAGLELARNRKARYRREYGLPMSQYGLLYAYQRGVCAICLGERDDAPKVEGLVVDHDHKSALVRGLLCDRCNRGIGFFADDPALLASAIVYLTSKLPMNMTHPELSPVEDAV